MKELEAELQYFKKLMKEPEYMINICDGLSKCEETIITIIGFIEFVVISKLTDLVSDAQINQDERVLVDVSELVWLLSLYHLFDGPSRKL